MVARPASPPDGVVEGLLIGVAVVRDEVVFEVARLVVTVIGEAFGVVVFGGVVVTILLVVTFLGVVVVLVVDVVVAVRLMLGGGKFFHVVSEKAEYEARHYYIFISR